MCARCEGARDVAKAARELEQACVVRFLSEASTAFVLPAPPPDFAELLARIK